MKRALVTGGSGGIGAAIARRLARDGLRVIVHANGHPDQAEATVSAIMSEGGYAEAVVFDVCDASQSRKELERLLEDGPVQVLVNNAGIHDDAPLAGMRLEQWRRVVAVALDGFYNVTQPLLLPMLGTRWGRIISMSSVAGVTGNRGQTNYAAAKAGLHGATRSLAREVASRGVTVNAIAPGIIESPMTARLFTGAQIDALVPMKRAGTAEEVAHLVSFLASDGAGYISGQVIGINGGLA
ncbi:MAG: 3-oxoacyl-ACP reductase FabG [Gammaproteobacteria bacterium]|nr:3-oxoacyl-ACP reductase FabG [Gammaproteobacteria bacterium]